MRQSYHFEPSRGWINDPNGLIFFRGRYHAFFQHNPKSPRWDTMHWGHAVSDDLIHWEELPIALFPDAPYDKDGGCWSGTAIEHSGRLYVFYTSVCDELGQTQSVAWSDDGISFTKYPGNPVILPPVETVNRDFRDPKVFEYGGAFYIAVCNRVEKTATSAGGRILLYKSANLLNWSYSGVLYDGPECGIMPECADFFLSPDNSGEFILMFSRFTDRRTTVFVRGAFDGERFTPVKDGVSAPEIGPHFYAPQTLQAPDGRRILIGWVVDRGVQAPMNQRSQGCFSLPRNLTVEGGIVRSRPIAEVQALLHKERTTTGEISVCYDAKTVEIFDEAGENVVTLWNADIAKNEIL